ncbi:MAG: PD-(D/E)XK nuclease-like domain-containing protein [Planctomycetes bacterium]|nr:PD-(D/E)XK nuclease-like domain-containing protein [Planctomycetota bacterium]MCB9912650.1 PD-(D/E)XK nuclease-like domain-containing protein [Planctomycetota bacterium]
MGAPVLPAGYAAGFHRGLPSDEYHADGAISRSRLWNLIDQTPYYANENPQLDSSGFLVGEATHCLLLEPEALPRRFVVYEGRRDARTKDYKAFLEANPGKPILSTAEVSTVRKLGERINTSELGCWAFSAGEPEVSGFWKDPETGLMLKFRPDWVDFERDLIVDVKTTKSVRTQALKSSFRQYGYHIQDHHYRAGYFALTGRWPRFVFLFIDKGPSVFQFRWIGLSNEDRAFASEQHAEALASWAECARKNTWPSYPDRFETLSPIFHNDFRN